MQEWPFHCGRQMRVITTWRVKHATNGSHRQHVRRRRYRCVVCGSEERTVEFPHDRLQRVRLRQPHKYRRFPVQYVGECDRCPHQQCVWNEKPAACPITIKLHILSKRNGIAPHPDDLLAIPLNTRTMLDYLLTLGSCVIALNLTFCPF